MCSFHLLVKFDVCPCPARLPNVSMPPNLAGSASRSAEAGRVIKSPTAKGYLLVSSIVIVVQYLLRHSISLQVIDPCATGPTGTQRAPRHPRRCTTSAADPLLPASSTPATWEPLRSFARAGQCASEYSQRPFR